jgi:stage V sporulation protein B
MHCRQSLLTGTMVLSAASIANRLLGFVYQVFLIRLIGTDGIGLFTMVFPVYILALVLGSLGIPVAVAHLVSAAVGRRDFSRVYRLLYLSLAYTAGFSLVVTVAALLSARFLTGKIFSDPATYLPFVCLLPGVFIVSVCSVFRGFFQGLQDMTPTAASQTLEQAVRVAAGLLLAWLFIRHGVVAAACGASLGVVCGEAAGFLLMLGFFFYRRALSPLPRRALSGSAGLLTWEIFRFALPVTLMRLVSTAFLSLDAVLIPHRLVTAGFTPREATGIYGQFAGIAETLLHTPGMVTVALSTALVPAVSEALTTRDTRLLNSRINNALRLTAFTGFPSAAVLFLLPEEICQVVFGYPEAGGALQVLALGALFLYLQQTTTGVLQGLGQPFIPFRNLVVASVFKVAGIYFLTGIPAYGIRGAAAALVCNFVMIGVLNLLDLRQLTGCSIRFADIFLKPLVASAVAGALVFAMYSYLAACSVGAVPNLCATLVLGGAAYAAVLFLTGALSRQDRERLSNIFCKILTAIKR